MEVLITGGTSFVGRNLTMEATRPFHRNLDLSDYEQVKRFDWEGDVIIHAAHSGQYGNSTLEDFDKNVAMMCNLRVRWPRAKIIAFSSGAVFDRSKPVVKARETDLSFPTDYYGLSKRATFDLADVTLIPFGIYGETRFVWECRRKKKVTIIQDALFSWVNASDLTSAVEWAYDKKGRFNLCAYDMTLTEIAKHEGAQISYLKKGMGNEYTGRKSIVPLTICPKD
jgi:nucleoside-diphosphate-sugar epimerase